MIGSSTSQLGSALRKLTSSWQVPTAPAPPHEMPRNPDGKEAIPKYHAEPPTWLTTAHSSGDLGELRHFAEIHSELVYFGQGFMDSFRRDQISQRIYFLIIM